MYSWWQIWNFHACQYKQYRPVHNSSSIQTTVAVCIELFHTPWKVVCECIVVLRHGWNSSIQLENEKVKLIVTVIGQKELLFCGFEVEFFVGYLQQWRLKIPLKSPRWNLLCQYIYTYIITFCDSQKKPWKGFPSWCVVEGFKELFLCSWEKFIRNYSVF